MSSRAFDRLRDQDVERYPLSVLPIFVGAREFDQASYEVCEFASLAQDVIDEQLALGWAEPIDVL
jgi:hypothetical protein